MTEKEIPIGTDLTKLPTIGTYKQNSELAEAIRKVMEESPRIPMLDDIPQELYGEIYERKEFGRMIEEGLFIPYDGKGYFHDGTKETNISIQDTSLTPDDVEKYPYVVWYNK